ncbi:MAG: hypothetical protein DWQ40_08695, partial [Actinobacteria bacterium]
AVWVSAARMGQTAGPLIAGIALSVMSTGTVFMVGSSVAGLIFLIGLLGPFSAVRRDRPTEPRPSQL